MDKKQVALQYLKLLGQGNPKEIIALFAEGGMVSSPLYGTISAMDFYPKLTNATTESILYFKDFFESPTTNSAALFFAYCSTLSNGNKVDFDVVDILEFDKKNNIKTLTIIYDASKTKPLVDSSN